MRTRYVFLFHYCLLSGLFFDALSPIALLGSPRSPGSNQPEVVLQFGHTDWVNALALNHNRSLIASSSDSSIMIWDFNSGRLLRTLNGHNFYVLSLAFSPDGNTLASGGADGTVSLWDVYSGKHICEFTDHDDSIRNVTFSPDGTLLASGGDDRKLRIWDFARRRVIHELEIGESVHSIDFSPNGNLIATNGCPVKIDKNKIDKDLPPRENVFVFLTEAPRKHLASTWDVKTGQLIREYEGIDNSIGCITFSNDGATLAAGKQDNTIDLWNVHTGRLTRTLDVAGKPLRQDVEGHRARIDSIAFINNDSELLSIDDDGEIRRWNITTGRTIEVHKEGTDGCISPLVSNDGSTVLIGTYANSTKIWDTSRKRTFCVLPGHFNGSELADMSLNPKWSHLAAAFNKWRNDKKGLVGLVLWDLLSGQMTYTNDTFTDTVQALTFSPDGEHLAFGLRNTICVQDVTSGIKTGEYESPTGNFVALKYTPSGDRLIACKDLFGVSFQVFDISSEKIVKTVHPPPGLGRFHSMSCDTLCTAFSRNRSLSLWMISERDHSTSLVDFFASGDNKSHNREVASICFSTDDKIVASGSKDNTVKLWSSETGQLLNILNTGDSVSFVAFSSDGAFVAAGLQNGTIQLWDAHEGTFLRKLLPSQPEHTLAVAKNICFSPDSKTLAVSRVKGNAVSFYDVPTGKELLRLLTAGEEDWLAVTPEGLFDGTEAAMQKVCFRIGDGLNVVPVDRFFNDFYRPGLLASIAAGERPLPEQAIGLIPPPTVTLARTNPEEAGSRRVSFKVTATDQGGGISGLRLYHNGARLITQGEEIRNEDGVTREFFVDLVEGENRLRATAFCRDGSMEAEPAELVLKYEKPLDRAKLFVVAVGVSDYQHDPLDLSYADNDATQIAALCRTRGSSLYESVHVQLLTDSKATSENLHAAMEKVREKAEPQDVLMVLLSGHGKMVGQRYFFLPYDIQIPEFGDIDEAIRQGGIPHDRIYGWMTRSPALKRVLILDTCYAGGAVTSADRYFALLDANKARDPFQFRGAIERQSRSSGIYTIAAAAATSKAQEVDELRHGVLSYTLLAAFEGVDGGPLVGEPMTTNNPDGVAEVNDWITYAAGRVPRLMESYFGRRHDVHSYSKGNSFPILPLKP